MSGIHVRRQTDPHTRAISLVISRGFGTTVSVTLWWFSAIYHRRDRDLERLLAAKVDELEDAQRSA